MKTVIVIPTYNERENVPKVIDSIEKYVNEIPKHEFFLLIVDDNSPDGTADVVRTKMKEYKNIYLITGSKQGLGIAYARGFRYAIEKLSAEVVFEMDADGQHDPKYLKDFMREFDNGYDYVIGSRYIKGGSIPTDWGIHRKILSFFGSFVARTILHVYFVKDFTGGFKASRVKGYLEKINLDYLISKRYAYKIQYLYLMYKLNAKIKEIPIDFKSRDKDFSKSTAEDILESIRVIFKLRFSKVTEYLK